MEIEVGTGFLQGDYADSVRLGLTAYQCYGTRFFA